MRYKLQGPGGSEWTGELYVCISRQYQTQLGHAVAVCAVMRKVAGLIPDDVIGIFH